MTNVFKLVIVSPVLCFYLILVFNLIAAITLITSPIGLLLTLFTCGYCTSRHIDSCIDQVYLKVFGFGKLTQIGFRRLNTLSQLAFQSTTSLALGFRMFYVGRNNYEILYDVDISFQALLFNVGQFALSTLILCVECRLYKTSLLNYLAVSLTGTFNWVPYLNLMQDIEGDGEAPDYVFNYELMSTRVCCLDFVREFEFSQLTLKKLATHMQSLTNNRERKRRYKISFGQNCLRHISFDELLE